MSEPFQVNLSRTHPSQSWGFRLQGGVDFPTPLSIQSVTPGTIADQCGLKTGDNILQINTTPSDQITHDDAKRHILMAGDHFSLIVKRGTVNIWKPQVTPLSQLKGDPQYPPPSGEEEQYVQRTSLAANKGAGLPDINFYNRTARGFPGSGLSGVPPPTSPTVPVVMNKQYNTPMGMYSTSSALEAFEAQSEALVGEVEGYQQPQQQQPGGYGAPAPAPAAQPGAIRSVRAPTGPPPNVQQQQAQHMTCKACGSLIIGVFVKVKGEPMHAECYKCVRCHKSLKNQGFFTVEGQMHCEACATAVSAPPGSDMVATAVYR